MSESVSKEQIEKARQMSAIEFLKTHRPSELVKCGTNEYQLQSHDSFKINEQSSVWHWKSRDIGGRKALDYLVKVEGFSFVSAVQALVENTPTYTPQKHVPIADKSAFKLPAKSSDMRRVFGYLMSRGIAFDVIKYCAQQGILYESLPYHNAVFVGKDENGKPKYAALRGTFDNTPEPFKIDVAGSDKRHCFCIHPSMPTKTLAIYESAPDAMAHATLEGCKFDKWRLSLGGIAVPQNAYPREFKKPLALENFLKNHPEITHIEICLDNDHAGRVASELIVNAYDATYHTKVNLPQKDGQDFADVAKEFNKNNYTKNKEKSENER